MPSSTHRTSILSPVRLMVLLATLGCSVISPSGDRNDPRVDANVAVFASTDRRVAAFGTSDGQRRWTTQLPDLRGVAPFGAGLPLSGSIVGTSEIIAVAGWDLYGLDPSSGDIRWTFTPADQFSATDYLVAADGVIYSPGSTAVFAVDAATGAQRWRRDLVVDRPERPFAPVLHDGVLYIGGAGVASDGGLIGGHVWALDAGTGAVLWRTFVGDSMAPEQSAGVVRGVAVAGDLVVVAGMNGERLALDRTTGTVVWNRERLESTPFSNGVVVFGSLAVAVSGTGVVYGFSVETGDDRWVPLNLQAAVGQEPERGDGIIYATATGPLMAVDTAGKLRWVFGGESPLILFTSSATLFQGRLYISANDFDLDGGGFYALNVPK